MFCCSSAWRIVTAPSHSAAAQRPAAYAKARGAPGQSACCVVPGNGCTRSLLSERCPNNTRQLLPFRLIVTRELHQRTLLTLGTLVPVPSSSPAFSIICRRDGTASRSSAILSLRFVRYLRSMSLCAVRSPLGFGLSPVAPCFFC